jgi:hypothetical protein
MRLSFLFALLALFVLFTPTQRASGLGSFACLFPAFSVSHVAPFNWLKSAYLKNADFCEFVSRVEALYADGKVAILKSRLYGDFT